MSFRPIKYNQGQEIFKVRIEDPSGAYIDNWVFMKCDFQKFVQIISNKYGLYPKKEDKEQKKDRDLEWAM